MSETVQKQTGDEVENSSEVQDLTSSDFFSKLVGISEAAAITGRNKGRISIDTNGGKLHFVLNEKRQKRYKVADLFQLYGFKNPTKTSSEEVKKPQETPTETLIELALLKQQVHNQAEQLRQSQEEIRDLRQKQDKQLETINRLTLLLPAPPSTSSALVASIEPERHPEPPQRLPFWKRLFS